MLAYIKLIAYTCSIINKTTRLTKKKSKIMETNVTLGEEIAKTIKTKVDERYNHYVNFGIPLDLNKLNEKKWKEREIKRILENIKWTLNNY